MPVIDDTTVFNLVSINVSLTEFSVGPIWLYHAANLDADPWDPSPTWVETVPYESRSGAPPDASDPQVAEVIKRVKAGTARVYYSGPGGVKWLEKDLPQQFQPFRFMHQLHQEEGYKAPGMIVEHGDTSRTANGEVPVITFKGDIEPGLYEPETPTINYQLAELEVHPVNQSRFQLRLNVNPDDEMLDSDLDDHPTIRALSRFFEANRTTGIAIPTTGLNLATAWWDRRFILTMPNGTTLEFEVATILTAFGAGEIIHAWTLSILVSNSGTYDAEQLEALFSSHTEDIVTQGISVKSHLGKHNNPLYGNEVDFGHNRKTGFEDGLPFDSIVDSGSTTIHKVAKLNDRVIRYTDLPTNNAGQRLTPRPNERPLANAIHVKGLSANALIRMQRPHLMAYFLNNRRPLAIHNRDPLYNLELLYWDSLNAVTLTPGQHGEFNFSYEDNGGGEVVGVIPIRHHEANVGDLGRISGGYWRFDSGHWCRPFNTPAVADFGYSDGDTFEIGTETHTNGQQLAATNSGLFVPQALKILKSGHMDFFQDLEVEIVADTSGNESSGNVPEGHFTLLYLLRGTSFIELNRADHRVFSGHGNSRGYKWEAHTAVQLGDIIIPLFVYPTSTTMNISNYLSVVTFHRDVEVNVDVAKVYIPVNA